MRDSPAGSLEARGRMLLLCGLGLCAGGLLLGTPGAVLAGALLLAALTEALLRLRAALQPGLAPCGLQATLQVIGQEARAPQTSARPHRVGVTLPLRLALQVPPPHAGISLHLQQWWTGSGVEVQEGGLRDLVLQDGTATAQVQVLTHNAAVHRILGVEARLCDAMGLLSARVFLPCPCEIAVLPRSLPFDLRAVAETRRMAPRMGQGQRPDRVPGHGDDLRELREHQPGDPFKHIAWKAAARRGRLMSRSFEREQTRALYAVLDTGATMRDGRPGHGPLDQAFDLVHSLAEACARSHDPFGLCLVDGRVVDERPVLEGLASLRDTDRALLEVRRAVAEDLAPQDDEALLARVAQYLIAIERVPLPDAGGTDAHKLHHRQRVVMAALARLPERERSPALRGADPSPRIDVAILRRYCRATDLALPYRSALSAADRISGLVAGLRRALAARKGPFAIVVVSDFRRLSGACDPLWQAFAQARARGHRVMAVAIREVQETDVLDLVHHVDDIDTARGLQRADHAARQHLLDEVAEGCRKAGAAFLADPSPLELLALWRGG